MFCCFKKYATLRKQHSNGKSTVWRCISYWKREIFIVTLVYWSVASICCLKKSNHGNVQIFRPKHRWGLLWSVKDLGFITNMFKKHPPLEQLQLVPLEECRPAMRKSYILIYGHGKSLGCLRVCVIWGAHTHGEFFRTHTSACFTKIRATWWWRILLI